MENLLNQARKYKVGLILAHQNLDQFDPKLRATVMANTSIKLAGGVSAKDATALAREMNCEPEDIQSVQKREGVTQFFLSIRNRPPTFLNVDLGVMEKQERLTEEEPERIKEQNRLRYCGRVGELASLARTIETEIVTVGKQEML